jgi:NADH dehydrogenase
MQQIIIIGAGFAGMYAAIAAAKLRHDQGVSPDALRIAVVSPEPHLVIRPRLYEQKPETMAAPLTDLFDALDIDYIQGRAETIDTAANMVTVVDAGGKASTHAYDRLVLAAGSDLFRPAIPGIEHAFSTSQLDEAVALDRHLHALASRPSTPARNTVVVGGAGFTGIEVATEMPARLRAILGEDADIRVVIVDRSASVAPEMGAEPRPYIEETLGRLGVESKLGAGVGSLDGKGVTLGDGEYIESDTVIWAAGMRASPLTAQIPAERDPLGRIIGEADLRVPGIANVFATGDTVKAATDADGHFSLMSCQHAIRLGSFAGYNAAADLLDLATKPYDQPSYVTCLDLGTDIAIFTRGWTPKVEITGADAKKVKQEINTVWIYPPKADKETAFAAAENFRTIDF